MKILLSADPFLPVPPTQYGGIERIVDGLARGLLKHGHEVGLLAHPDSSVAVTAFYPWSGTPATADLCRHMLSVRRAVADFEPDLFHSFSRLAYLLPLARSDVPKLMSFQRNTGGGSIRLALRLIRNLGFTACSRFIAAQGECVAGRWYAIPNFVEPERYTFRKSVAADAPLVFLSRVEAIKGVDWAIEIARRAGRRLVIAGNLVDDPEGQAYWKEQVEPHVDGKQVIYVGPVNDIGKNVLLGEAAALLVPIQWNEPFGIVFIEAMACGTPVISCPRGALPEIVKDGTHGFLVRSVEEGVAAVGKIGSVDRKTCRERVESFFTLEKVLVQYLALYSEMTGKMIGGRAC